MSSNVSVLEDKALASRHLKDTELFDNELLGFCHNDEGPGLASKYYGSKLYNCAVFSFFFLSPLGWHMLPLHASAEGCLTGWPSVQLQGRD